MSTSQSVSEALALGLDASRVKMALRRRYREHGRAFDTTQELVSAAFTVQLEQEERAGVENSESQPAFRRVASSTPALAVPQRQQQEQGSEGPQSMDFEVQQSESQTAAEGGGSSSPTSVVRFKRNATTIIRIVIHHYVAFLLNQVRPPKLARSNSNPDVHPQQTKSEPATPSTSAKKEGEEDKKSQTMPHSSTVSEQLSGET